MHSRIASVQDPFADFPPDVRRKINRAIKLDAYVRDGIVTDYAELARLGHVTRALPHRSWTSTCWLRTYSRRSLSCRGR